jgi:electron transfer flavoprotein alpha subunit
VFFVYCEIEDGHVADVSQELLTKGRSLANELKCKLEAIAIGYHWKALKKYFPLRSRCVACGRR